MIGEPLKRVEDPPLLRGKGCFVDDIQPDGCLHLALLRSPYPKARIRRIDTSAALGMPGVVRVLTGKDVPDLRIITPQVIPGMNVPDFPVLAQGSVHACGTPVAAVLAESTAQAQDAAEAIEVDYEPLPSVSNAEAAVDPGAPLAHDDLRSNVCYTVSRGSGDIEAAFAQADYVARMHISSPRLASVALEPRGIVVQPEARGGLTIWLSTQGPHRIRAEIANLLGIPESTIRLVAPDVGGGFGTKGPLYREDLLAIHLALELGKPVKWVATRSEDLTATIQGRDQAMVSELALKRDGTMLGLRARVVANLGAYLHSSTAGPPQRMMSMATGCYRIPAVHVEVVGVLTNTVPTGPYRGAGRPESVLNIERLAEIAARELGIDRLELRRKNFIQPDQFPYRAATGSEYDSGDYERSLAEALHLANYEQLLHARDEARARGELCGIGFSTFVEPSGGAGFESGAIRVERTGAVTVLTGSSAHGQGHETVFAQLVADKLKTSMDQVSVYHGDTLIIQQGTGTFGSRSAVMGGGALAIAAGRLLDKARQIAGHLVEAAPEDMVQVGGGFAVAGAPDRKVSWRQMATAAYQGSLPAGMERGLQETAFFDPRREAWGFGCHLAMVNIDRETGQPAITTLVLVDDSGVVLNPLIFNAQVHGGVAQGLGQALREQVAYDESGQLLSGTLMDYAVPRAADMPEMILGETCTPNPFNPLGVKGVGEAGCNGCPPAIANAVMDALAPLGIQHLDMPYTAPKIWAAIQGSSAQG